MKPPIDLSRPISSLFDVVPEFVTYALLRKALVLGPGVLEPELRSWMLGQGWEVQRRRIDGIAHRGFFQPSTGTVAGEVQAAAAAQAFDAFLCRAWGETDLSSAELVTDWEGVRRFMVREWLGEVHATNDDDTVVLDQLKTDFDQHEEEHNGRGGAYEIEFEIGGVSIERVCGFAAKDGAAGHEQAGAVAWRDMATAPKDGTLLRLLVDFEHHATEDGEGPQPTIGSNTWDNHHDFDEWQFAGWSWEQDCYTQGVGKPVGWLPMLDAAPGAAIAAREQEEIADAVVRMVGEMDDRTSPEDWPEAMLVTGPELHAFILLAFERAAESREEAPATGHLLPLNDDLIAILGRPNFTCIRIAQALRLCGVEIKSKAEHEQAAVIHFLLTRYMRHGSDWGKHADADLRNMLDQAEAKNKAAMAQPMAAPLETGERVAHG